MMTRKVTQMLAAFSYTLFEATLVYAHNCGSLSDCFSSVKAAVITGVGILSIVALHILTDTSFGRKFQTILRTYFRNRAEEAGEFPPYDETITHDRIRDHIATQLRDRDVQEPTTHTGDQKPWHEISWLSQADNYNAEILHAARKHNVDPDLIRAVIHVETTRGWYDITLRPSDLNASILPMNVNHDYWHRITNMPRQALENPVINIDIGTSILSNITTSLPPNTGIDIIATLYNDINARVVNDFGQRVEYIYRQKPWLD